MLARTLCPLAPHRPGRSHAHPRLRARRARQRRHARRGRPLLRAEELCRGAARLPAAPQGQRRAADRRDEWAYRVAVCLGKTRQWTAPSPRHGLRKAASRYSVGGARALLDGPASTPPVPTSAIGRAAVSITAPARRRARRRRPRRWRTSRCRLWPTPSTLWSGTGAMSGHSAGGSRGAAALNAAEQVQLDFDLSRVLELDGRIGAWASRKSWPPASSQQWKADPRAPYDPGWPWREALYLYEHIRRLAGRRSHSAALSLLGEALWSETTARASAATCPGHTAAPAAAPR